MEIDILWSTSTYAAIAVAGLVSYFVYTYVMEFELITGQAAWADLSREDVSYVKST